MTTKIDQRIIDNFNSRAPFKWEDATLLVLAEVGSHSHNTYVPKDDPNAVDDTDYMGVIVPPMSFTLGMKTWDNLKFQFEELDCVFYSFRKFVGLLAKGNPNVLGLLYLNPVNRVYAHSIWRHVILEHRDAFLNKQLTFDSFFGYAYSQLKRMTSFDLMTQRKWELALEVIHILGNTKEDVINNRPLNSPTDRQCRRIAELTQYEEGYDVAVEAGWKIFPGAPMVFDVATQRIGEAIQTIKTIHARHFQGYMGEKRKNLVKKYGYDTKNAGHLVRLMRMCKEYLVNGELQVWRTTDAEEIKSIKTGKWTLEEVRAEADKLSAEARELFDTSPLPMLPNYDDIDQLCIDVYLETYGLDRQ